MKSDAAPPIQPGTVTAVLVCWNHARFVRQAVTSVVEQTRRPSQIIVFDNGSTDGSRELLQGLAEEFGFTLILQENIGLVRTLNRGIAMATGEFFAATATDDAWLPEKTMLQAAFLEAHSDVGLVSAQVLIVDEHNTPIEWFNVHRPGRATFANLMTSGNTVYGPTMMCRTEVLRRIGCYDESLRIEDYSLALRLLHLDVAVHVLPDVVTLYRRHSTNWTNNSMLDELLEIGHRYRDRPEYRGYIAYHFPRRFRTLVEAGDRRRALRWLWDEPVEWTWNNVGVGVLMMLVPEALLRWAKRLRALRSAST
jgi:GT2 family glycosyltransferase